MNTEESASIDCSICLDILTEPKIIPCGHVICRSCLVTWLQAQETEADCPLCRYAIMGIREVPKGFQFRLLAEMMADILPTHLVVKATARGRHDVTPETCLGCEGLLCASHDTPHPLCPGPQHPQQISQHEFEARATFKVLSEKLRKMVDQMTEIQAFLKDKNDEFISLVADNETIVLLRAQSVQFVMGLQKEAGQLCTILLTHQHLMERLQESHHVVATILMKDAMQRRVETLDKKMDKCVEESVSWAFL